MAVQLIINHKEALCLEEALKTFESKAQRKTRDGILRQLDYLLHSKPKTEGWAPIRSSWPVGVTKREGRGNWSFKSQASVTGKFSKPSKRQLTAQEVLDSL